MVPPHVGSTPYVDCRSRRCTRYTLVRELTPRCSSCRRGVALASGAHAHILGMNPGNSSADRGVQRVARWRGRYQQLKSAVAELGRLPRRSDPVPRGLVDWTKNQRRNPTLTREQERLLEELPPWSWEPLADQFIRRAEELRDFVVSNRRLPNRRASGPKERALAEWLGRQNRRLARKELRPERARLLRYATGGRR